MECHQSIQYQSTNFISPLIFQHTNCRTVAAYWNQEQSTILQLVTMFVQLWVMAHEIIDESPTMFLSAFLRIIFKIFSNINSSFFTNFFIMFCFGLSKFIVIQKIVKDFLNDCARFGYWFKYWNFSTLCSYVETHWQFQQWSRKID